MPRSSRHKSHKQSKHSSRDYSDSEEDVVKMKGKSSKDDRSTRSHKDFASGEKRKISSHVQEGKDIKVLEEYVSSKRRKEKADVVIGGDRWNEGGDDNGNNERHVEKEMHKGETAKVETKSKENSSNGENLRTESKIKNKRYDSLTAGERKEESSASAVVEKEESKSKGESKRKSEKDSSLRKDRKDSKDKDSKSDMEKKLVQESKSDDAEVKLLEMVVLKKQETQLIDISRDKQGKRSRENNAEQTSLDELRINQLDKDIDKKIHRKTKGSPEREKYYDEPKESDYKRLSTNGDHAKDLKYRDDKHKDGIYADKYQVDGHKDDRRRDEKYREESGKINKHHDDKYREDGERDARRRDDRHREDGDRDGRRKHEKYRGDGERDSKRKDDKYHEDGDSHHRRKDGRDHEDGDKDIRRRDEKYYEDGDRDDRRMDISCRDDVDRDYRYKEEKYREDNKRDMQYKSSKLDDGFDREKRQRDAKYSDERSTRDRTGDKPDAKSSRDDGYATGHNVRKSSTYDDSPTRDDRTARYQDDQGRRVTYEKEDYGDFKSRGSKDQRSDVEKKSASSAWTTSRNNDIELTSSHGRRRSSPTSSSHAPRDNYRPMKQDEFKYRDYNYDERPRHSINSARDYTGPTGGSEKTSSSRSLDKLGQKDDNHFADLSSERRLKSDTRSSPLQPVDKSPSSSADRRQFTRPNIRRNTNADESIPRSVGSRDRKDYSAKDVHPAEELVQADADTVSISSPFVRNIHFSSGSRSVHPPPPSFLGSGEDDGRGKPNTRHRRNVEPNMARMQGNNAWRGVPSWPSPAANGFLPFPHAPTFHSVMQPFSAQPMFNLRPSMELNHQSSPYRIHNADMFSGPGRPIGWGESGAMYGRSDWDHSRNIMSGARGCETSASDLWKGPNRTASMEVPTSEEENNNSIRSVDEGLTGQSVQPPQNRVDQQEDSTTGVMQLTTSFEKGDIGAALLRCEDSGDVAKVLRKDDVPVCRVYLSKLDISSELAEPDLFDKCTGLIDTDKIICSDIDDFKILYMEDVEAKMTSPGPFDLALFALTDVSIFKKSMYLYKRQKVDFSTEYVEKPQVLTEFIPKSSREDKIVHKDNTEKLYTIDSVFCVDETTETLQRKIDRPAGEIITENSDYAVDHLQHEPLPEESAKGSDVGLEHVRDVSVGSASKNEALKLVDIKYDVSSEAMMPESVNLSRIHHSPESTH